MSMRQLIHAGWVPDQHGAWPMALLPVLVGCSLAGWSVSHVCLFLTWFFGFLFFNVARPWLKARAGSRVRQRLRLSFHTYLDLTIACFFFLLFSLDVVLVAGNLPWAMLCGGLLGATFWFLSRGSERAFGARVLTILVSVLMLPISFTLLHPTLGWQFNLGWLLGSLYFWFFVGSTLFVRSVLRGRGQVRWLLYSLVWHSFGLLISYVWLGFAGFMGAVFLFTRAGLIPFLLSRGVSFSVKRIGLLEMGSTLVFVNTVFFV